jgi:hypothetical protein
MNIERLKTEFLRNKTKTAMLGGLLVVLGFFGVKAFMNGGPSPASANISTENSATATVEAVAPGEMDAKVQQATELWNIMRTKRGLTPASAYKLEGEKYKFVKTYVPQPQPAAATEIKTVENTNTPKLPSPEEQEKIKQEAINSQARQLVLQAVLTGNNPTVLINSKRLGIGDQVNGFKVISIEDRLVRAVKDGVEVVIPLRDPTK